MQPRHRWFRGDEQPLHTRILVSLCQIALSRTTPLDAGAMRFQGPSGGRVSRLYRFALTRFLLYDSGSFGGYNYGVEILSVGMPGHYVHGLDRGRSGANDGQHERGLHEDGHVQLY